MKRILLTMIAALTITMTFTSLTYAETLTPPADYDPPENAKACSDSGGKPNLSPEGKYAGCTSTAPLPNERTEILRGCQKSVGPDGAANWECDCAACGHAADADQYPPLVGRPDDWPAKEVPAHYVSDPNRQKI